MTPPNYFRFVKKGDAAGASGLAGVMPSDNLILLLDPSEDCYSDNGTTAATDGDDLYRMDDQSSTGVNAIQTTAARRPTWHESDSNWNDKPYVRFWEAGDNGDTMIVPKNANQITTTGMTVYFISELTHSGNYDVLYVKNNGSSDVVAGISLTTHGGGTNAPKREFSLTAYDKVNDNISSGDHYRTDGRYIVTNAWTMDSSSNNCMVMYRNMLKTAGSGTSQVEASTISDYNAVADNDIRINGYSDTYNTGHSRFKLFGMIWYDTQHTDSEIEANVSALNDYFDLSIFGA